MQEKNKYERDFKLLALTAKHQLEANNFKGALKTLDSANALLNKNISNKEANTFIFNMLTGDACMENKNYKAALVHYQKALAITKVFDNISVKVLKILHGKIGIALNQVQKWEQSVQHFQKQFEISEEESSYLSTIDESNYTLYAISLTGAKKYGMAIEIGLAGIKKSKENTDFSTSVLGMQIHSLCKTYILINQIEKGLMLYIDTLSFLEQQETLNKALFKEDILLFGRFLMNEEMQIPKETLKKAKSFLQNLMDKYVVNKPNY